ncbi:MAG: hypothetical protein LBV39_04190 [Bacteroidales bacterium]|jgi:hypothetical protein|nr:hypothetical protein [Bacteroidales bacterium]
MYNNPPRFAGIRRDTKFSPNHTGNDAAIFDFTVQCLRDSGITVNEYTEGDCADGIEEAFILTMAREPRTVRLLQEKEDKGAVVVNSGYGIENCYRNNMVRLLQHPDVPVPATITIASRNFSPDCFDALGGQSFWIKRGDFHAIHKEDVSFARNADEGRELVGEYASRGIDTVVICKHLEGDLVKFYGVSGSDFFYWFYPSETSHSKFGLEALNGKVRNMPFQPDRLKSIAARAAGLLNIAVYGGDAIITPDGNISVIDMNDWPSFAPCREQAAPVIAGVILKRLG